MKRIFSCFLYLSLYISILHAQNHKDTIWSNATLPDIVNYAIRNQPLILQNITDEQVVENNIKIRLADWYPQINGGFNLQHYFQLPTAFSRDNSGNKVPFKSGLNYSSGFQLGATQNIFNRDLLLARHTATVLRIQSQQITIRSKIDIAVEVSKAFYDVLLSRQQVAVLNENILRLEKSYQNAYEQYKGGIVDKIDYKRAQIALNNTRAERKRAQDALPAKISLLKELMGLGENASISIKYDSLEMERSVSTDTVFEPSVHNRIEYQLLETQEKLLMENLKYYNSGYLPSVSAFGNYSPNFYNDQFGGLYGQTYPTSNIGIQLSIPIFQGGKRLYAIRNAHLQIQRLQLDKEIFTNQVNTQLNQALSNYKGNLAVYYAQKENIVLASDVFNTLQLQYNSGIKSYLDVVIAETDLRTAQLNYLDALYNVLSSKLDLEKAKGNINLIK